MTSDYIHTFLAVHDNLKYLIFQVSKTSSLQIRTFKNSATFTTPQYSQMSLTQQSEPSYGTLGLARGFHVKVAASRCHHEAKPRLETGIGQEPAQD